MSEGLYPDWGPDQVLLMKVRFDTLLKHHTPCVHKQDQVKLSKENCSVLDFATTQVFGSSHLNSHEHAAQLYLNDQMLSQISVIFQQIINVQPESMLQKHD